MKIGYAIVRRERTTTWFYTHNKEANPWSLNPSDAFIYQTWLMARGRALLCEGDVVFAWGVHSPLFVR